MKNGDYCSKCGIVDFLFCFVFWRFSIVVVLWLLAAFGYMSNHTSKYKANGDQFRTRFQVFLN